MDDYFFTVCSDFDILPQNVVVAILALRKTSLSFHRHIKSEVIQHDALQQSILQVYMDHISQVNDRTATLIVNEYIRHIDDLYLQSTSSANLKCMEFFFDNKERINALTAQLPEWEFDRLNLANCKYLFDHKHKAEQIAGLQKRILAEMDRVFTHYLDLTGRAVSGNSQVPYFRGSGSSYDMIRYQLDYRSFFCGEAASVTFKAYLSRPVLESCGVDPADEEFIGELNKVGCSFSQNSDKWVLISEQSYHPESANIYQVVRDNLNENWLDFETYLGGVSDQNQTQLFYRQVAANLAAEGYECREHESGLLFTNDEIDFSLQYKVAFIAPDYVETILYGNISQWGFYHRLLDNNPATETFILFDRRQAQAIPEIRDETRMDSVLNFEALVKKSFREKDTGKALQRFMNELGQFDQLTDYLADGMM